MLAAVVIWGITGGFAALIVGIFVVVAVLVGINQAIQLFRH